MREGGRSAGFKGGCTKRGKTSGKRFFLNPETGITTYTESGFGSRFGIPHYSSVFVAKIRISPCRQSSASAHCGNPGIGFMDVSSRRLTFAGPQVSPSGGVQGERATNRETRPLTRRAAQAGPSSEVFTKHETRNTNHGFFRITAFAAVRFAVGARGVASPETAVRTTAPAGKSLFSSSPLFTIVHHCSLLFAIVRHCSPKNIVLRQSPRAARSLLSCAWWRGMGRLWRGMGRPVLLSAHRPRRQQGLSGFHETRDPRPGYCQARGVSRREFRGFHESRNTRHETRPFFESRPFCRVGRPLMREGGRPAGFKGGCTKRCVNEWKGVFLNPETGITTFTESRLGSRPGISHNIPLCVG